MGNAPIYTDRELRYLQWYNYRITYFFYAGTISFLLLLGAFNILSRYLYARLNRRQTKKNADEVDTAQSQSFKMLGLFAVYRKITYRRSYLLELLGVGSAGQATVLLAYFVLSFSLCFCGALNRWDYTAHHAARLSFAHIPLLVGLASRELGVISWMTGLHSSTLMVLHRWMGRNVLFFVGLHIIGRAYTNEPKINFKHSYQAWGLVGAILWFLMAILSIKVIRSRFYKFFIFSHLGCFTLSLIALSLHRPQVAPYIIAGAVIYSADRISRLLSICYYAFTSRKTTGGAIATIEILSDDVLKVKVESKRRWYPGQHAYLHAPLLDAGGHPFSIAASFLPINHLEGKQKPKTAVQTFVVRVHKGFTLKLKEKALAEREKSMNDSMEEGTTPIQISPAFTEGPYGHNLRLHQYESVLLVVGGTGVTFALPFLIDLVRRARSSYLGGSKPLTTKRLTFVWSVRSKAEVESIGDELRQALHYAPPGFLDLQIYVTRLEPSSTLGVPNSQLPPPPLPVSFASTASLSSSADNMFKLPNSYLESVSSTTSNYDRRCSTSSEATTFSYLPTSPTDSKLPPIPPSEPSLTLIPNSVPISSIVLPLIPGRCRPRDILERVVAKTSFSGSVAAASCGPSQLVNEMGRVCSDINEPSRVLRGEHRLNVMLHVERYGW